MDALHLPHITIKDPKAGDTLKALYKLNLLKRLESSTYAFVQSIETLYTSEVSLLGYLDKFKEDVEISEVVGDSDDGDEPKTLEDYVRSSEEAEDIEQTLEEFGFDSEAVRADDVDGDGDEIDVTVGEVSEFIREDLALLARFLTIFIGDVARDSETLSDEIVGVRSWLDSVGVGTLPILRRKLTNLCTLVRT